MTDSTTPPTDPLILGPSPVAPDFPRTLIIAPPRPLMALKASMISKILSWTRDDVVLANRSSFPSYLLLSLVPLTNTHSLPRSVRETHA